MARYSHKGHDSIRYDITQNIAIRYDTRYIYTIRSESASPYVRTASKQATAHNTFCLSTLSPLQVPGYWTTGEATVGGRPFLWSPGSFSRATVSTGRQTIPAVETLHSCYCLAAAQHGRFAAAQLKYLVIAQSFMRVVRNIDFVWGVISAIKICHDTTSISWYSIRYDISCHR